MDFLRKLKENSIKYKNTICYKVYDQSITYGELWEKANYYGSFLKREGFSSVVIFGNKSINILISIIACLIAKRSYVPVDFCTPLNRIKQIIEDCNSSLIITDEILELDNVNVVRLDELIKYSNKEALDIENDIAYIIFTSGSTGRAKGVPISYENLDNFISWISRHDYLNTANNLNVLNQASFAFDLSVADLYYSLNNGHTLVSLTREEQESYSNIYNKIGKENINFIVSTPSFIRMCLLDKNFNSYNFPDLKCIYFCGEILDKQLVKKIFDFFPNMYIINAYGPTEATSAISSIRITKNMIDNEEALPIGDMNTLATEVFIENNEIVLKGKSFSNGYLNFVGGFYKDSGINCFRTGDLGFIHDNKLYFSGRKDNQIKYMGYRIELNDIEENIKQIDGVIDCAVIAKLDSFNKVKMIKAFVVLNDITLVDVKNKLKTVLPNYMIPKVMIALDALPINNNGKVDRKVLNEI